MALIATRSERLFYQPATNRAPTAMHEVVSKTPVNITVESDKAANEDVNGAGRGRSYVSRIKGTLEYETPMNMQLLTSLLFPSQVPTTSAGVPIATYASDFHGFNPSTAISTLSGSIRRSTLDTDDIARVNDVPPVQYLYTNQQHSLRLHDTRAGYKIMIETGNTGSQVRLGVSAMGNLIAQPYLSPVTPTVTAPTENTSSFPTSGFTVWFVDGRSGTATTTRIDRITGLTIDMGYEVTHNAILQADGATTGYAEPSVSKIMPMVEITRLYSDNAALNTLINTESKTNTEDTRFGLLVHMTNAGGNSMMFWLPRVNLTEPTYGDDGDIKTQTFTVEQQHRHNPAGATADQLAAFYYTTEPEEATGAQGPADTAEDIE